MKKMLASLVASAFLMAAPAFAAPTAAPKMPAKTMSKMAPKSKSMSSMKKTAPKAKATPKSK